MDNEQIYDIIANLLLGTITGEQQAALDAWLAESESNKQLFAQFMQQSDLADAYKAAKQSEIHSNKEFGRKGIAQKLYSLRHSRIAMISAAASILLVVGLYIWHSYITVVAPEFDQMSLAALTAAEKEGRADASVTIINDKCETVETLQSVAEENGTISNMLEIVKGKFSYPVINYTASVTTDDDKEFWMTLSDGTRVHLNNNSTLTYPMIFDGKSREVTLEGEAYFAVAKDRRHPFIVHTQFGDVKEYGTEFVVNTCYDSSESAGSEGIVGRGMSVVLVQGSISITPKKGEEHMMVPNELAVVPFGGKSCLMKTVDTAPFTSWNTGTFAFDCCPMEALMQVIGRWYKLDVEYAHEGYRKIQFTGELDRYDGIEDDLNAINQITGMNIKVVDDKIVVE